MIRTACVSAALIAASVTPGLALAFRANTAAQAPTEITAAEAAPFLGDWTLSMQGPNGPGEFALSVKVEAEKVVAEISNETTPTQKINTIAKADKNLVLSYTFPYEAMTINAIVTLKPQADGKMTAQIDFASGSYIMTGSAVKKDKTK